MKKILLVTGLVCLVLGMCIALVLGSTMSQTSSAEYCMSCHYHEQADADWKIPAQSATSRHRKTDSSGTI